MPQQLTALCFGLKVHRSRPNGWRLFDAVLLVDIWRPIQALPLRIAPGLGALMLYRRY